MITIAFEGIDGSGKDTLIKEVEEILIKNRVPVRKINSIGDSLLSKALRETLAIKDMNKFPNRKIMALAFIGELQNTNNIIVNHRNKTNQHEVLLINRWIYSTMAYNSRSIEEMDTIYNYYINLIVPDIVVYLDIDINTAIERICKRNGKNFEAYETPNTLGMVLDNYKTIINRYFGGKDDNSLINDILFELDGNAPPYMNAIELLEAANLDDIIDFIEYNNVNT